MTRDSGNSILSLSLGVFVLNVAHFAYDCGDRFSNDLQIQKQTALTHIFNIELDHFVEGLFILARNLP